MRLAFPIVMLLCGASTVAPAADFERMKAREYHSGIRDAHKAYQQGDTAAALPQLQRYACAGDKATQFVLGSLHLLGQGTPADALQAYGWYAVAAETGERKFRLAFEELEKLIPAQHRDAAQELATDRIRRYGVKAARITCERRPNLGSQVKELQCDLAIQRQGGFVDVRSCDD